MDVNITPWQIVGASAFAGAMYIAKFATEFTAKYRQAANVATDVPGPETRFPLGTVWAFDEFDDPLTMWTDIVEKYGDKEEGIVRLQMLDQPFFVINHHEHLKPILNACPHRSSAESGEFFGFGKDYNIVRWWVGDKSVFYAEHEKHDEWVHLRRLLARSFLSVNLKRHVMPMRAVHEKFGEYLQRQIDKSPSGVAEVDFSRALFPMTFDILGVSAFSGDFGGIKSLEGGETQKMFVAFQSLLSEGAKRFYTKLTKRPWLKPSNMWIPVQSNRYLQQLRTCLREEVSALISKRKEQLKSSSSEKYSDFMQSLLDARADDSSFQFTDEYLRDNLVTILFAGHDTTATTLMYALYAVAKHASVQDRIQAELDEVITADTPMDEDTYGKLVYTQAVIKEALRLYAPVPVAIRCTQQDVTLADKYTIPKNSFILVSTYCAMRMEHNWTEPLEFKPERHLTNDAPFHAFMPFMHGRRNCIGMRFAELSSALVLAYLCKNFSFSVPPDYVMKCEAALPMQRPVNGLPLLISKR